MTHEPFSLAFTLFAAGLPLWVKFFNFIVFVLILGALLRKPFSQGLKSRAQNILDALQRAGRERAAAEAKLKELETRFSALNQEIAAIKSQAERDAQAERQRIAETAQAEAARLRALVRLEIEGAMRAARMELKEFAAAKAVELAEVTLRRDMTDADRANFIMRYADHLERVN
jgi:F-type H+-transporting ATPase subunit b